MKSILVKIINKYITLIINIKKNTGETFITDNYKT